MKTGMFLSHIFTLLECDQKENFARILQRFASEGLAYVDCSSKEFRNRDAAELKKQLNDCGVQISSIYHSALCDVLVNQGASRMADDIKSQLDNCALTGSKLFMPVPKVQCNASQEECRKFILEYLNQATELAEQYGIQTVIENYSQPISTCATIADIDFYLSQIPQLGYALDTGNYWFNDLDSLDACKLFLPRIAHVHLKDIQPMTTDAARTLLGKRFDCVSPGSGVIHIAEILDVLTSFGYDGVFSLEVNTKNDLQKKLMQSMKYLQNRICG